MKKIFAILLTFVMLIPNVKAESIMLSSPMEYFSIAKPSETKNIFSSSWGNINQYFGFLSNFYLYSGNNSNVRVCINEFIEVKPSITYTLFDFNSTRVLVYIYLFDSNFNQTFYNFFYSDDISRFTPKDNSQYFLLCYKFNSFNESSFTFFNNRKILLQEGSFTKDELTYIEYKATSTDEPTVETDTTLTGFYNIYLNKLGMLADYTTENKYFLYFIGIILLFICLEIFLSLFFIKGRRSMK